jgi:hypothetical protein
MGEGLIRFQDKINRKAIKFFEAQEEVSFEEYLNFVNSRMGTEFQEAFVREFYNHFLGKRDEKQAVNKH